MRDFAALFASTSSRTKKIVTLVTVLVLMSVGASAQNIGWGYYFYMYSPQAGDVYTRGVSTIGISWGYTYCPCYVSKTVSLAVSSNGGASWTTIVSGLYGGDQYYSWAIPVSQTASTDYYIRVYEDDSYSWGTTYFNEPAMAGPFTILPGCVIPTISSPPRSATVCANTSHTFTVTSDMNDGVYNWKRNGTTVATTTVPSYTINPVTTADAGVYTVQLVQNCDNSKQITSAGGTLTVNVAPTITKHPVPTLAICQSGRDTLKSGAIGVGKTFQWQKDGVNIPGATDSNYIVDNAQLTSQGSYTVVVSGTCAPPAVSNASVVSVVVRPAITTEPTSLALCPGSNGQLSVVATGSSLSYQWFRNGQPVAGSGATLPFTGYTIAQDGQYYVETTSNVPNPNNCQVRVRSAVVTVTGYRPPTIVTQPTAAEGCVGKSVALTSEFEGFGLTYSWTRNGTPIANSSSNSLLLSNLTTGDAGDYRVTATGTCGLSVSSNAVRVSVVKTPTFSAQPQGRDLTAGEPLNLSLAASDATSIQWFKDGVALAGQTGTTLNIPSVTLADAGYYHATVKNSCSGISSAYARVTIIDPSSLQPRLTMSQTTADLGEIPLGYSKTQTFTDLIQNTGTADMQVDDISFGSTGFAVANATATPFTLTPSQMSSVTVRATAENMSPMTGVLTVTTNAPVPTGLLTITATPVLRYDAPTSVNYGDVMLPATKDSCIQLVNNSAMAISIEQATVSGPDGSLFTVTSTLPINIDAGGTGEICVRFTPSAVGTNFTAQLNFTSSTGGNSTMALTGGAVISSVSELDPATGVSVYPNPARDEVSIRTANPSTITIVNARGAKVATLNTTVDRLVATWNTKNLNGASVAAGTYTVRITGTQGTFTVPLVVIR